MELSHWPKMTTKNKLNRRKSMWMKQNNKWMNTWGINMKECRNNNMAIKMCARKNSNKACGHGSLGGYEYYIKYFNPSYDHTQKSYIRAKIKWKVKMLIASLRTSLH